MPTLDGAATAGDGTGKGPGDGTALRGAGRGDGAAAGGAGAIEAPVARGAGDVEAPAGRLEPRDAVAAVTMSLQGSHLVACRNGSSAAGLNPADIDGDAAREEAPAMPPVEPIPDANTDNRPTASDVGGSSTGGFVEDERGSNSEWPPPAVAAGGRALGRGFGWV